MKITDITINGVYGFIDLQGTVPGQGSQTSPTKGASSEYYKIFNGEDIVVFDKINVWGQRNGVKVGGVHDNKLIEFWCSPKNLRVKE